MVVVRMAVAHVVVACFVGACLVVEYAGAARRVLVGAPLYHGPRGPRATRGTGGQAAATGIHARLIATGYTGSLPVAAVAFALANCRFCFRHSMEKGLP
jgi:hypothetical protein